MNTQDNCKWILSSMVGVLALRALRSREAGGTNGTLRRWTRRYGSQREPFHHSRHGFQPKP